MSWKTVNVCPLELLRGTGSRDKLKLLKSFPSLSSFSRLCWRQIVQGNVSNSDKLPDKHKRAACVMR